MILSKRELLILVLLVAIVIGGASAGIVRSILKSYEKPAINTWCPETMVTIDSVIANSGHADEGKIPRIDAVKPAFLKLPFVRLSDSAGPKDSPIKYEGYLLSSPFPNDMTSILDYERNKTQLCVAFPYNSVFVLYEPLRIK